MHNIYLSLPKYSNYCEYLRLNKNILTRDDLKNLSQKEIKKTVLVAIDKPRHSDLLLPFKRKLLYRLEYDVARSIYNKYDIYLYYFLFDYIYEWDSNYLLNSRSFLPFFPSRIGILHENINVRESYNLTYFLEKDFNKEKSFLISTVVSNKSVLDWHRKRLNLIFKLKSSLPQISLYGRGFNSIEDKSDALINYKYHICSENSPAGPSEKLWDPLLCQCIVFYAGSLDLVHPNLRCAIIQIKLDDLNFSLDIINKELNTQQRLNSIKYTDWIKIKHTIINYYTFENTVLNHVNFL